MITANLKTKLLFLGLQNTFYLDFLAHQNFYERNMTFVWFLRHLLWLSEPFFTLVVDTSVFIDHTICMFIPIDASM